MLKRTAFIFVALQMLFFNHPTAFAQVGGCSRPKVAVKLADFYDRTYEVLTRQYPFQTKEKWIEQIEQEMINKLKANSPGVDIFPADSSTNYEYIIPYKLAVIGCGEEVKIGNLVSNKETCYWIQGTIYSHDACGLAGIGFQSADIEYKDIYSAIAFFALKMGNLATVTDQHERDRPVPPRGPKMQINVESKSVSPLEEERELIIKASITNCKGEPVYDKIGQRYGVIAGPIETKRGKTDPIGKNAFEAYDGWWKISPDPQGMVFLKYTLIKGTNSGREKIQFTACGLGDKVDESTEIKIDGLEIKISPKRKEVSNGDHTNIQIDLNKIDEKGAKTPVPGKSIQVKKEGLKDGAVTPAGDPDTDQNGRAALTYRAGDQDEQVKFLARFQPKGFEGAVQDEGEINVGKANYTANIQFSKTWDYDRESAHYEGEFKGTISGAFRKNKESRSPMPLFDATGMTVTWSYRDKVTITSPRQGCEALQSEHAGSGTFPIQSQSRMFLTSFQGLGSAVQQIATMGLVDTYQIAVAGAAPEQKIPGRYLSDGCKTYRNESLSPPQVGIELKFKMASDKHFSGNKSWSSRGEGTGAAAELQCSDLTEKPFNARPFSPSSPGSDFKYTVIWDVTKIKD